MAPRTILYTGKGGVGKTSVAAATARRCAAAGQRTVVLSTDPAHSLADVLEAPVGDEPTELAPNLWAQQVSAQVELERHWSAVQGWLGQVLIDRGVERIAAEELTVPPGGDELFSLLRLKRHVEEGEWDVIVVDCAPTGETLRLLSFPEAARWWLGKLVGRETQLLAAARPLARAFLDLRLPDEEVMGEVQGLVANLVAMHDLLRDRDAVSVRLVMTPDRMVVAESMRTFTYLSLYGYLTDAVIVNRVFPAELAGTYFGAWREVQQAELERVRDGFAPYPCCARRTSRPRCWAPGCSTGSRTRSSRTAIPPRCCTPAWRRSSASRTAAGTCGSPCRSRTGGTCRSRRSATSWSCAWTGASAPWCCRRRWRRCGRPAPRSTTARWWCALPERDDLDAVRAHLDEAHAAADRLVREAQRQAEETTASDVPPRGWDATGSAPTPTSGPDLRVLLGLLDAVREAVPADLSRQLAEALRDLLVALRAVIDWYLERLGEPAPDRARVEVEDIPLD